MVLMLILILASAVKGIKFLAASFPPNLAGITRFKTALHLRFIASAE